MFSEPIFCSKIAQKGKSCSGLLESQKLGPNAIRCSKVAEHKSRSVQRSSKTRKIGYPCIREILVVTFSHLTVRPFVHPPVRLHHGRLEVFLAGNRMTTRVLWSRYTRKTFKWHPNRNFLVNEKHPLCREYHIGHQLVRARQTETKARSQFVLLNADDPSHGKTSAPNKCCD